jgi:hypothetical protein
LRTPFRRENLKRARELQTGEEQMGEEWITGCDSARAARYGIPWIP